MDIRPETCHKKHRRTRHCGPLAKQASRGALPMTWAAIGTELASWRSPQSRATTRASSSLCRAGLSHTKAPLSSTIFRFNGKAMTLEARRSPLGNPRPGHLIPTMVLLEDGRSYPNGCRTETLREAIQENLPSCCTQGSCWF